MKFDDNFSQAALLAMQQAVNDALLKKRKLGQYAFQYIDGAVQRIEPHELPVVEEVANDRSAQ